MLIGKMDNQLSAIWVLDDFPIVLETYRIFDIYYRMPSYLLKKASFIIVYH